MRQSPSIGTGPLAVLETLLGNPLVFCDRFSQRGENPFVRYS